MSADPVVGMVMPNSEGLVPPDARGPGARMLYPEGVRLISTGLGLKSLTAATITAMTGSR